MFYFTNDYRQLSQFSKKKNVKKDSKCMEVEKNIVIRAIYNVDNWLSLKAEISIIE